MIANIKDHLILHINLYLNKTKFINLRAYINSETLYKKIYLVLKHHKNYLKTLKHLNTYITMHFDIDKLILYKIAIIHLFNYKLDHKTPILLMPHKPK